MARRSWFARDDVSSTGWWCLLIFAIGGCCGVLAADSAALEPSSAVAHGEEGVCYRPLSDVIWGFLVTLLALTVSLWGSIKHRGDNGVLACVPIIVGVFAPLVDVTQIVDRSLRCVSLLWNCHKMEYPTARIMSFSWLKFLCSSLFPWSKSPARILASCDIVVYVSRNSPLLRKVWLWRRTFQVMDESEAMVVGENGARTFRNDQYVRGEISQEGTGLLVWKEVFCEPQGFKRLPKYDELKYLRGNSGFAIIAVAVQAFGYIYAVGFRSAKNLRISPLEVIGLVFNIILLMKVLFYGTCNLCHRPLVIYMVKDWEQEVDEFSDNDPQNFERCGLRKVHVLICFGIFSSLYTLLIYCIVSRAKATNILVVLPIIVFSLGLCLDFLGFQIVEVDQNNDRRRGVIIAAVGILVNLVAYIWATVGTVLYWRTMHFDTRADLINLSQIIPFIGHAHQFVAFAMNLDLGPPDECNFVISPACKFLRAPAEMRVQLQQPFSKPYLECLPHLGHY